MIQNWSQQKLCKVKNASDLRNEWEGDKNLIFNRDAFICSGNEFIRNKFIRKKAKVLGLNIF